MRARGVVALLLVLGILGGGIYLARQRLTGAAAKPAAPQYATATVSQGPLVADVLGFGPLQPDFLAPLQASASGTVSQAMVQQGDVVHKGEVLAVLTDPQLGATIQKDQVTLQQDEQALASALGVPVARAMQDSVAAGGIPVTAPQTGRATEVDVQVGSAVKQGEVLAKIVDDSHVIIQAGLVSYDYQVASVGDRVTVRFDQFDGDVAGTITSISPNPTPENGYLVYPATITLVNPGLLAPKDQGYLTIYTQTGQYTLPSEVSISDYGQSTVVSSPVDGTVENVTVQQNGWVQQGQDLMTIGGPSATTAIAQLRAQVTQDQTTLADDEQTQKDLTVVSTLDGTVGNWFVQTGQRVQQGQPLGTVFNSQSMNLTIQVNELQVANVHPGQQVVVTAPGLPGKTFTGRVTGVDTMGNTQNGLATFGVHIAVDATAGLLPGMTADARIVVQSVADAIQVPIEAVVQQGTQAEVELLQDGRPVAVPVTVGLVNDQDAQITSGLQAGETVITGMAGQSLPGLGQAGTAAGSGTATAPGAVAKTAVGVGALRGTAAGATLKAPAPQTAGGKG